MENILSVLVESFAKQGVWAILCLYFIWEGKKREDKLMAHIEKYDESLSSLAVQINNLATDFKEFKQDLKQ